MPYIKDGDRERVLTTGIPMSPGELNYDFTMTIKDYLGHHGLSYKTINDIIGALEGAKMEFYRRVAVPYEDQKMATNGDVYS
jgi:hypothetical protein